ncbi:MAG TPA: sugar phosphate nucleotidyltransferase [Candidatus Babeliales bacterium]|nr:sugar phosphate nucleotidyltransferase [Candidatus Babeliales bacterium]
MRKAVIAAAGFGTRFLPQTKAMPKEMLPIVDKPIIQYVVEELVEAGIEDIIIITGYSKRSIEDHFDSISADLEANLKNAGKTELLNQTKKISELANFIYIRQKGPYGNATPLLNAEDIVGNEPFIYTWGDDFVISRPSRFKQLINTHSQLGGSVITCFPAQTDEDYNRYAFVRGREISESIIDIDQIIEKPGKERAKSNIISVGGYLFEPTLFDYLKREREVLKDNKEFVFQPAVQRMLEDGHKVYGCQIQNGRFHDTGNKLDYMKTAVDFALMHDDLSEDFRKFLSSKVGK